MQFFPISPGFVPKLAQHLLQKCTVILKVERAAA